jgi:catechol 2,3-dioxygenase-like lactoylglutathione lyase family enzyme
MTPLAPHYHVGIVVPDIAAARTLFTELLGVTWGPTLHLDATEYRDAAGRDLVFPTTFCYSADEPRIELLEEVPGSVWVRNEFSNLHHIGFWCDELVADSARLRDLGCPLQLAGRAGDQAPASFAYHGHELGIRVELVSGDLREAMSFLFTPAEG